MSIQESYPVTRINVVDPRTLCDEHLRAEWRELTRIPNCILSGKYGISDIPSQYTVRTNGNPSGGKGHVKFFLNKLYWLREHYYAILKECRRRRFNVTDYWPPEVNETTYPQLFNDFKPSREDKKLNRRRIKERWPKNAHYYGIIVCSYLELKILLSSVKYTQSGLHMPKLRSTVNLLPHFIG